jgi:hypothetical protein
LTTNLRQTDASSASFARPEEASSALAEDGLCDLHEEIAMLSTLGEFRLSNKLDFRMCDEWVATLADSTEVVVGDFRGAPSQVGIEKAVSVVQSRGELEQRALQLLVSFTTEPGRWRLVTLDFGAEARRQDCEFLMCFALQTPNSQLSITGAYVEIGFALLRSQVSEPLFILTVKSACGLLA